MTSGPRSGIPHSTWRRRRIRPGHLIAIETAANYNRSPRSAVPHRRRRTSSQLARENYEICLEALQAALDHMKPGYPCEQAHDAAQKVIDRHNRTTGYRKRLGYSLGISFAPTGAKANPQPQRWRRYSGLTAGMAFHLPITIREYAKFHGRGQRERDCHRARARDAEYNPTRSGGGVKPASASSLRFPVQGTRSSGMR